MRDFLYCLIFPHPRNNHRARVLHPKPLLFLISFFIFSSMFFSSSFNPISQKIRAFADISVQELMNATNQKRQENGLPALFINDALTNAASKKAEDMFAKNYWAHNSPDGTTPWFFIKQAGYDYVYAGENLARGFNSANDVVSAWMASPGHRANLLSANFKDVGFAVKSGTLNGESTFLVVQEFGSRSYIPATPQKTAMKKIKNKKVLGFETSPVIRNFSNLSVSSNIAILIMLSLVGIFVADTLLIRRKNIVRFVGHNMDHAIFLTAIVSIVAIISQGNVL